MVNASVIGSSVHRTPPQSPTAQSVPTTLKNAHVWEVVSQIPLGKRGTYLTAKLSPLNRHRLLSVEVHRLLPSFEDSVTETTGEKHASESVKKEAEACYIRILRPTARSAFLGKGGRHSEDAASKDDDSGAGTHTDGFQDDSTVNELDSSRFDGWTAKYRVPIRMVDIVEHNKRAVEIRGECKGHKYQREFVFQSEAAASEFIDIIKENKMLQEKRAQVRVESITSGITLEKDEQLTFLIDICSAMNLPRTDVGRDSDPYVTVRFNGRKIHKTHYISREDNPIWTLRSKSLFVWTIDAMELFQSEDGLIFEVKDYDAVGENESMGAFSVSPKTLYHWNGERKKFSLKPLLGKHDYGQVRLFCILTLAAFNFYLPTLHVTQLGERCTSCQEGHAT